MATATGRHGDSFDGAGARERRERGTGGKYLARRLRGRGASPLSSPGYCRDRGVDEYGHKRFTGVAQQLGEELERRTGKEVRTTVLGHVQRGGTPTAYDRVLATRFGLAAADAVHEGVSGVMVALRGTGPRWADVDLHSLDALRG